MTIEKARPDSYKRNMKTTMEEIIKKKKATHVIATMPRTRNHCCREEAVSNTYSACECSLSYPACKAPVACPAVPCSFALPQKRHDFRDKKSYLT
jgi:hypothetical protein